VVFRSGSWRKNFWAVLKSKKKIYIANDDFPNGLLYLKFYHNGIMIGGTFIVL
jgi:hypothetical protein